ncbi:MAG TPA: hypothetical protein PKA07_15010, partial [Micropruina sp.]|nr:hypothetical protein [Micropruina sp.]
PCPVTRIRLSLQSPSTEQAGAMASTIKVPVRVDAPVAGSQDVVAKGVNAVSRIATAVCNWCMTGGRR